LRTAKVIAFCYPARAKRKVFENKLQYFEIQAKDQKNKLKLAQSALNSDL
jgi:hypothetical protein